MSQDISCILEGWSFDPHELNVRLITGSDGSEKIQMRIDLGLLQMCMSGRPDGQRPHGCESYLDFYERQAAEYGAGYKLSGEAIDDLFREAWQYYHRYLCLFHLSRYEPVVRDTSRNLRLSAFVRQYGEKKRDKWRFDQYRPYLVMMHTRAQTMMALDTGDKSAALKAISQGCAALKEFLVDHNRPTDDSECFELEFLRRWRVQLAGDGEDDRSEARTATTMGKLHLHLQQAIDREDYERAALLRDQIKKLEQGPSANED